MAAVRFAGPDGVEELIPSPLVQIQKTNVYREDGKFDHSDVTFSLTGTIVNVGTSKDSPGADFDEMEGILAEQARIRNLFSVENGRLEIESNNGGGAFTIDAYCFVDSIAFDSGVWVNRCDYTIVLRSRGFADDQDYPEVENLVDN